MSADPELLRLLERAVEALERIAGVMAGEPKAIVPESVLAADVEAGLSLRQCATKHGVGLGRVRGSVARASVNGDRA